MIFFFWASSPTLDETQYEELTNLNKFPAKENDSIQGNQSYFHTPLKPAKLEQFKERLAVWEAEHKPSSAEADIKKPTDDGIVPNSDSFEDNKADDLPF